VIGVLKQGAEVVEVFGVLKQVGEVVGGVWGFKTKGWGLLGC